MGTRKLDVVQNFRRAIPLILVCINHAPATRAAPASVWTCTGHTGRTGCRLYTWPYYTPSKGPSNCSKC